MGSKRGVTCPGIHSSWGWGPTQGCQAPGFPNPDPHLSLLLVSPNLPHLRGSGGKLPSRALCSLWNTRLGWHSVPLPEWPQLADVHLRGSHPSQAQAGAAWCGMGPLLEIVTFSCRLAPAVDLARVRSIGSLCSEPRPCSALPEPQFPHLYNGLGGMGGPVLVTGPCAPPSLSRRWSGGSGWGRSRLPEKPSSPAPTTRRGLNSTARCRYLAGAGPWERDASRPACLPHSCVF